MSGAEAVAIVGIISNILQLTDFCGRITDRAAEFAGRTADLPGSFGDLRVVLAVVRLNLKKLNTRIKTTETDQDTAETLKDLVTIIEKEVRIVLTHLQNLPPPGASWAKVTLKAIASVCNESKVKRATDSILQNVDLLSQTVTASLPTADEIARAVNEKSNMNGIDRKLSMILDRMKSQAISKAKSNSEAFNKQMQENRAAGGADFQVKGATQINNTYITVTIPYEEYGKQIDKNGGKLMVPNKNLPFLPLKHALSNPNLPRLDEETPYLGQNVIAAPAFDFATEYPSDDSKLAFRPHHSRSNSTKTYRHSFSNAERKDSPFDDLHSLDGDTVVGAPSIVASQFDVGKRSTYPPVPPPPRSPRHMSEPSLYTPTLEPLSTVPQAELHATVFELPSGLSYNDTSTPSVVETPSEVGTASDVWSETLVNPAGDNGSNNGVPSIVTTAAAAQEEDTVAIAEVNYHMRQGAAAVTRNPSEAKRSYMMGMNKARQITAYSAAFAVRKYRSLSAGAVGLALCTQDRERYLSKARGYNEQALAAACSTRDTALELRVLLDEADLQMKEARMLEKSGRDSVMKHFTAFGAYQSVAGRLTEAATVRARMQGGVQAGVIVNNNNNEQGGRRRNRETNSSMAAIRALADGGSSFASADPSVADYNTHALALIGSGKAAAQLARSAGMFRSAHGAILAPTAYYEQALAACKVGMEIAARQAARAEAGGDPDWARKPAEELVWIKETEEGIMRLLGHGKVGPG